MVFPVAADVVAKYWECLRAGMPIVESARIACTATVAEPVPRRSNAMTSTESLTAGADQTLRRIPSCLLARYQDLLLRRPGFEWDHPLPLDAFHPSATGYPSLRPPASANRTEVVRLKR